MTDAAHVAGRLGWKPPPPQTQSPPLTGSEPVLSGAVAPHFTATSKTTTSKTTSASTTESPTSVHVAHSDAHSDEDHRSSQAHLASNDRC
mmetsp:Transcript_76007/g.216953  ORF Transcript_76007/g.216953 Transcript_76007/m.216953 type:complete len:90 (+) Transcript_76007:121-390(+)